MLTDEQTTELRGMVGDFDAPSVITYVESLLAQARAEEREAVKAVIKNGSFLHDQSPPARFAREVVEAIDRDAAVRAHKDAP